MKISLTLLALLFLSISCKNNSTGKPNTTKKVETHAYLSINHSDEQSVLRRKLLNLALNDSMDIKIEKIESPKVLAGDEFKFFDDSFKPDEVNMLEYKNLKPSSAEIIVSFKNHQEIYFVSEGISRETAFKQLNLVSDLDAQFYWLETSNTTLLKDKTYFLVNATKSEMKDNDVYFNQQKINLGSDFNGKNFVFSKHQVVELKIRAEYFSKETFIPTSFLVGQRGPCQPFVCIPCLYKVETLSEKLVKQDLSLDQYSNFEIHLDGKKIEIDQQHLIKNAEGMFIVTLYLTDIMDTELASLEIKNKPENSIIKMVKPMGTTASCAPSVFAERGIDITPVVNMSVEMTVKGRY
ncbi:MAG: hypothetical protein Q7U04_15050 [Bacteriovorax sp.]|nr:hypothetical protein [Bacteriovorax sp.]